MLTRNASVLGSGNAVTAQTAGIEPFADSAGRNLADLCYLTSSEDRSHRGLSNHLDCSHTEGRRDPPDLHPQTLQRGNPCLSGFFGRDTTRKWCLSPGKRLSDKSPCRPPGIVVTYHVVGGNHRFDPWSMAPWVAGRPLVAERPALRRDESKLSCPPESARRYLAPPSDQSPSDVCSFAPL